MRLLLTVLIGGALSCGLGFALVYAATEGMTCYDDAGSCRLAEAVGYLMVMVYAALASIVLGVAVWRAPRARAVTLAALALIAPVLGTLALAAIRNGLPRDFFHEVQGLLQLYAPPLLIVGVQWALLRAYMRRRVPV
jgi:hypothetical protein